MKNIRNFVVNNTEWVVFTSYTSNGMSTGLIFSSGDLTYSCPNYGFLFKSLSEDTLSASKNETFNILDLRFLVLAIHRLSVMYPETHDFFERLDKEMTNSGNRIPHYFTLDDVISLYKKTNGNNARVNFDNLIKFLERTYPKFTYNTMSLLDEYNHLLTPTWELVVEDSTYIVEREQKPVGHYITFSTESGFIYSLSVNDNVENIEEKLLNYEHRLYIFGRLTDGNDVLIARLLYTLRHIFQSDKTLKTLNDINYTFSMTEEKRYVLSE